MNSAVTGGAGVPARFVPEDLLDRLDLESFEAGPATILPVKEVSGTLSRASAASMARNAAAPAEFSIASSCPGAISWVAAAELASEASDLDSIGVAGVETAVAGVAAGAGGGATGSGAVVS